MTVDDAEAIREILKGVDDHLRALQERLSSLEDRVGKIEWHMAHPVPNVRGGG